MTKKTKNSSIWAKILKKKDPPKGKQKTKSEKEKIKKNFNEKPGK